MATAVPTSRSLISWKYLGTPNSAVDIYLVKNGAPPYWTLATSTPVGSDGSGSFKWTIPASLPADSYTIQLNAGPYWDASDAAFSIETGTP